MNKFSPTKRITYSVEIFVRKLLPIQRFLLTVKYFLHFFELVYGIASTL